LINSFANLQEEVTNVKTKLVDLELQVEKNTSEIESMRSRFENNPVSSATASASLAFQGKKRKEQEHTGIFSSNKLL
jgi:predicted  nucleic acid-binding Zn-ribbon protein